MSRFFDLIVPLAKVPDANALGYSIGVLLEENADLFTFDLYTGEELTHRGAVLSYISSTHTDALQAACENGDLDDGAQKTWWWNMNHTRTVSACCLLTLPTGYWSWQASMDSVPVTDYPQS